MPLGLCCTNGRWQEHSILQGGPGLPCIHPAIYQLGEQISMSSLEVEALPSAEDIPRNASTVDLLEMIDLVSYHHYNYVNLFENYCYISFLTIQLDNADTLDSINNRGY